MSNNIFFTSCHFNHSPVKLQPLYCYQLLKYPKTNPILIATDEYSLNFIQRLKGICLLCPKSVDNYDFGFSFQREIWILYSQKLFSAKAIQLAQAIQQSGASKILAIWINARSAKEYRYDIR